MADLGELLSIDEHDNTFHIMGILSCSSPSYLEGYLQNSPEGEYLAIHDGSITRPNEANDSAYMEKGTHWYLQELDLRVYVEEFSVQPYASGGFFVYLYVEDPDMKFQGRDMLELAASVVYRSLLSNLEQFGNPQIAKKP